MTRVILCSWMILILSSAAFGQVGDCVNPPANLISWWRFENSVLDNWDSNNGSSPAGAFFVSGKVGNAFSASQRYVLVPDSPSLRFTNALTIEAWVNLASFVSSTPRTILAKSGPPSGYGPFLQTFSYYLGTTNNTRVFFAVSAAGTVATAKSVSTSVALKPDQWSLVVATYDGTALRIFIDGALAAETNYTGGIFPGTSNLGIGAIPTGATALAWNFLGLLDEVSLYSRALSEQEIQAIYKSDSAGKCLTPPRILSQPLSQAVPANEDVKFSVTAIGSSPLRYQWRFNGQNIIGATNSTHILEKLKSENVGFYSVVISNSVGSATSADAGLKVYPPLSCVMPLDSILSWWPADNSYVDVVGRNNATPVLPAVPAFSALGKVNQAFNFNGISTRIGVLNASSLNFGSNANFSIEGWIKALSPSASTGIEPTRVYPYPNTPIVEKRAVTQSTAVGYSLSLYEGRLAFWLATNAPTTVSNNSSMFISAGPDLRDGFFHHIALSLTRGATNGGILYVDGNAVLTFDPTSRRGSLMNGNALFIGAPSTTLSNSYFFGQIDELTICNRALSFGEIQAIAGAGSAGKCKVAPSILTQPANQTVNVGSNAIISVAAAGSPTLRYQWFKLMGGSPLLLAGSTNSSLNFTNVQSTAGGQYYVRVTNFWGSVISSNATLTLMPAPAILPADSTLQFDLSAGQPHLQFTGVAGEQYLIQASTNLLDWTVIGTATDLGDGRFEFVDPDWTSYSACFYRIIAP